MAAFAGRQRGNVTRDQLLGNGVTTKVIRTRLANGSLFEVFPGVYLVGHEAEPPLSRECAALLYCAPRAMLSRRTAGRLMGLPVPRTADIEVTVVGCRRRAARPGLTISSIAHIESAELRRHDGLPITSPSLTLLDLGGLIGEATLVKALNEARVQDLVNDGELHDTLRAHANRRGARALARLLAREESEFAVESEGEALCLKLMIAHGLKPDRTRARVGPYRVDFLYESERLIVEVDGYRYHRTKERFVADRRRRAELMARGYDVLVVSWADLVDEPRETMSRLRAVRARYRAAALRA
jgi:very-short-patch-repair endonuclease